MMKTSSQSPQHKGLTSMENTQLRNEEEMNFFDNKADFSSLSHNNPFKNKHSRQEKSQQPPKQKQNKTKEELAEIRKQMMKAKFKDREDGAKRKNQPESVGDQSGILHSQQKVDSMERSLLAQPRSTISNQRSAQEKNGANSARNMELMTRLATGSKAVMDMKQMKQLATKNYQKLPEILKKKEEEKRREQLMENKRRAAEHQKMLNEKVRNNLKKKKERQGQLNQLP
mmetsp:Transcript_4890/g.8373  ORF Transcript_4890/g.8373 Transcript_4890/m.8373 type:complete len:228 (-) Transcript_4890:57-740(-)